MSKFLVPLSIIIVIVTVTTILVLAYMKMYAVEQELGADIIVYADNNTLNKRIKVSEQMKNPIIMILGEKEVDARTVNLRHKIRQERFEQPLEEFIYALEDEMKAKI